MSEAVMMSFDDGASPLEHHLNRLAAIRLALEILEHHGRLADREHAILRRAIAASDALAADLRAQESFAPSRAA